MTEAINTYIDHTILKPEANETAVKKIIDEAKKYHFASVCINPTWVELTAKELAGSGVATCTVIGFPLGANTSAVKAVEAQSAIAAGADEIDMVINVGAVKSGNWDLVKSDIAAVNAVKSDKILKVIIETCLLTDDEKVKACQIAKEVGADFVKTSTGFSTGGATVEDVKLMRETVGPDMGVKASGGIHNREEAEAMIAAGASRLGCSAGVAIMEGVTASGNY
ncbi:MAG: deoxyribose-phosphate aldolase [Streptococcaceae bacterium]|jgi:deoxyribose-phosphate aldolase|nr:deoxyribose-phosphate aldolase [Streptococcaceae bacterium]